MPETLTVWITTHYGKFLKEMGISDHLTCLLRNLYTGQEATAKTRHGTMYWFQIGKGVCQGCILSPCLFNLSTEYIMRNAGLDETLLCPMSESPSRKREGLQDNATRKKGSLLLTRVRAPAASNAVVWGQRAPSPSCYTNL